MGSTCRSLKFESIVLNSFVSNVSLRVNVVQVVLSCNEQTRSVLPTELTESVLSVVCLNETEKICEI